MATFDAVTIEALHTGPLRIKRGETVLIWGRAVENFEGVVQRLEEVLPGVWYVHIKGAGVLYPLSDVLEVTSR